MYNNFEGYMYGMIGMNGSIINLVTEMTKKMFELKNKPNSMEISKIPPTKLVPGRFYLIQYNYNGNLIWCPILALDYKVHKNKHILYAINLEYLPPKYKILLFNKIFKGISSRLDSMADKNLVLSESPMPLTFESVYKILKANGNMNFAITAYTIIDFNKKIKIKEAYLVSIKIAPEILMCDCKRYNSASMKELFTKIGGEEKTKLKTIIEQYDKIIEDYQEDSIAYHKLVSLFEQKLKLFND